MRNDMSYEGLRLVPTYTEIETGDAPAGFEEIATAADLAMMELLVEDFEDDDDSYEPSPQEIEALHEWLEAA